MIREQNTRTVDQAQMVHKELNDAKTSLHDHLQNSQKLQYQLVDQHKYGTACHEKVTQLEEKLQVATGSLTKESAAAAAQQAALAGVLAQRKLQGENVVLQAQIAQA